MFKLSVTGSAIALACIVASAEAQIVADGGFELGRPNPVWDEASTSFGSPICNTQICGGFFGGAFEGQWWAWFGGTTELEVGSLAQEVTIPSGQATLTFWLEINEASGNGTDFLTVSVDGAEVFGVLESDAGSFEPWTQVEVDISGFADGGTHVLRFDSTVTGPQRTNFYVDSVAIDVASVLLGDLDDDGDVDLFDAAGFIDCVTGPGGGAPAPCDRVDFDTDDDVDFRDFAFFQLAFTGS